jgi:hypothetical protein
MKSGTTSLHHYLAAHPQVFMSEPKEPGFFVEELTWGNGLDWYLDLFQAAGSARVIGESSTHYAKLPVHQGVPERILEFNPDARFVYLMRDPLKRIVSHYWHNVRNHFLEAEHRDFSKAVREFPGYLAYGDYAMQLEPWFRLFGRDRVYCMVYEELAADPAGQTDALRRWLGLDGPVPEHVFSERYNVRPDVIRKVRGSGVLNRLAHSNLWARMAPMVPKPLRRYASGSLATREVDPELEITEEMLAPLRPRVKVHIEALRNLLGRDFPQWL